MTSGGGTGAADVERRNAELAARYDEMMLFSADLGDGSLHQGYWESPADTSTLAEASLRFTDLMVDRLNAGPGDRVLDIGCGLGDPAIRLARTTGAAVVGVTNGPAQVERAAERARAAGAGDRVTFRRADAADLPFAADSFDAAWLIEAIWLMPDRLTVLREAARVLRPGGRLVFTDILAPAERPETMAALDEHRSEHGLPRTILPPARLEECGPLVERAGLVPVEITDITDRTVARTWACMRQRLAEHRARLAERFGSRVVELYETRMPLLEEAGLGYVVVTATVPVR